VAKVKKTAVVTGVRNVKASKATDRKEAAKAGSTKKVAKKKAATKQVATNSVVVKKAATRKAVKKKVARQKQTTKASSMSRVKSLSKARAKARFTPPAPVVRVTVKPLEPQAKCGAGTSVQYLFRVDETVNGRTTTHLVFFDRHGWYCEHGRNCPAVGHAKKYQGHMARAS